MSFERKDFYFLFFTSKIQKSKLDSTTKGKITKSDPKIKNEFFH